MTNHTEIYRAETIRSVLVAAGWVPLPRWSTPAEREQSDVSIIPVTRSYVVHVLPLGSRDGFGVDRLVADLAAAGIPARLAHRVVVVN